jgi:hypothetical protein
MRKASREMDAAFALEVLRWKEDTGVGRKGCSKNYQGRQTL